MLAIFAKMIADASWLWAKRKPDMLDEHTTVAEYPVVLDNEWSRYLAWRDAQVCSGCEAPFGTKDAWITETLCCDCGHKGVRGKSRADYQAETGNRYI